MKPHIIRADALALPLADESVDLIVTSPPYFALRSYRDGGKHYAGQIGAEATPTAFVDALISATREMVRVLKPSGSIWVNLGDKYAGQGMAPVSARQAEPYPAEGDSSAARTSSANCQPAASSVSPLSPSTAESHAASADLADLIHSSSIGPLSDMRQGARNGNRRSRPAPVAGVRGKSLIGIPWRYAIRCIDDLGLILRAEVIWSKPNGLPESVTDRVCRSHETWFHFVRSPRYYSAVDEIRDQHTAPTRQPGAHSMGGRDVNIQRSATGEWVGPNPAGKVPGSVWTIATQPLKVPTSLDVDHFAAYPMEWPRRIIRGWSPVGGVVLDSFGGTGTTALVATTLGRHGISIDMSADYCRLAKWRTTDSGELARAMQVEKPAMQTEGQISMLDLLEEGA